MWIGYNAFSIEPFTNMRQKQYDPTGFTISENDRAILRTELMRTGKTRSEIIRELIADLGKKQQSQNTKEAA